MNKIKHDIRESSPVEALIANPPSSLVRWGITAIAIVFVFALIASWLISYPNVVSGKITLTTSNPPAPLMAHTSGQIIDLFVEEGKEVKEGEYLAMIETAAELESVLWLSEMLEKETGDQGFNRETEQAYEFPLSPDLGELRSSYSVYKTSLDNYINYLTVDYYGKKLAAVQAEIDGINEYLNQLSAKEILFEEKLKLVQTEYLRDSSLYIQDVISLQEFENTSRMYFDEKIELEQIRLDRRTKEIDRAARFQSMADFNASREDERRKLYTLYESERLNLLTELELWFMKHLLISPINGRVTFSQFWGQNQVVEEGDIVLTVVPEGESRIIGRIELSMRRSGEVQRGQPVLIKLSAYPFMEHGMLEGKVESISKVATNDSYIADVSLPEGLISSYGKELQFSQNMSGTAEIMTVNMRLIERIIYPFRHLLEKNRLIKAD